MQEPSRVKVFWHFTDRLVALSHWGKAAQVIHYGHSIRVLRHFYFLEGPLKEQLDAWPGSPEEKLVELAACSFESTVVILVAWAFNLQTALGASPQQSLCQLVGFHVGETPSPSVRSVDLTAMPLPSNAEKTLRFSAFESKKIDWEQLDCKTW